MKCRALPSITGHDARTVPHDLSRKLPGQGVELLSVTAEHAEAIRTADPVLLDLHRDFVIDAPR